MIYTIIPELTTHFRKYANKFSLFFYLFRVMLMWFLHFLRFKYKYILAFEIIYFYLLIYIDAFLINICWSPHNIPYLIYFSFIFYLNFLQFFYLFINFFLTWYNSKCKYLKNIKSLIFYRYIQINRLMCNFLDLYHL